jgi:hypothetical protein
VFVAPECYNFDAVVSASCPLQPSSVPVNTARRFRPWWLPARLLRRHERLRDRYLNVDRATADLQILPGGGPGYCAVLPPAEVPARVIDLGPRPTSSDPACSLCIYLPVAHHACWCCLSGCDDTPWACHGSSDGAKALFLANGLALQGNMPRYAIRTDVAGLRLDRATELWWEFQSHPQGCGPSADTAAFEVELAALVVQSRCRCNPTDSTSACRETHRADGCRLLGASGVVESVRNAATEKRGQQR